jgi:hypothetical protein
LATQRSGAGEAQPIMGINQGIRPDINHNAAAVETAQKVVRYMRTAQALTGRKLEPDGCDAAPMISGSKSKAMRSHAHTRTQTSRDIFVVASHSDPTKFRRPWLVPIRRIGATDSKSTAADSRAHAWIGSASIAVRW